MRAWQMLGSCCEVPKPDPRVPAKGYCMDQQCCCTPAHHSRRLHKASLWPRPRGPSKLSVSTSIKPLRPMCAALPNPLLPSCRTSLPHPYQHNSGLLSTIARAWRAGRDILVSTAQLTMVSRSSSSSAFQLRPAPVDHDLTSDWELLGLRQTIRPFRRE